MASFTHAAFAPTEFFLPDRARPQRRLAFARALPLSSAASPARNAAAATPLLLVQGLYVRAC